MPILAGADGALNPNWETDWSAPFEWYNGRGHGDHPIVQLLRGRTYDDLYKHPWIYIAVSTLVDRKLQLPLKSYKEKSNGERVDGEYSAFGQLMAKPSSRMSRHDWRKHVTNTFLIHGESPLFKVRDDFGRPIELWPTHPSRLRYGPDEGGHRVPRTLLTPHEINSGHFWWFRSKLGEVQIPRRDLAIWKEFNPHSMHRGWSRLETLLDSLENDSAAGAATEAMWKRGGKPSFVLKHPSVFGNNPRASQRLADQFEAKHGGVENWGKPLVLEEGMEAVPLPIDNSLDWLKLHEMTTQLVISAFKLPPPAVGLLERATNNNIVELFRDIYKSTMPPIIDSFEECMHHEVRDGRMGRTDLQPDFGSAFFIEHLMEGVLAGTPEDEAKSMSLQIQSGLLTSAEGRRIKNRPHVEGSDVLLINGALVPIDEASRQTGATQPGEGIPIESPTKLPTPTDLLPAADAVPTLMGRLSRPQAVADVDLEALIDGMDEDVRLAVAGAVAAVEDAGGSVADLRTAIKELEI